MWWDALLKIGAGLVQAWNEWRAARRDAGLVDTGRRLQQADDQTAALKGDVDAQKTAEQVHDLSDDALDAELRDGPAGASTGR